VPNLPDARGIVESKRTFDLRMAYQDSLELDRQAQLYGHFDEPHAPTEPEPEPSDEDSSEYDYPDAPDFRGGLKPNWPAVMPISGGAPLPTDADYESWSSSLFAGEYDDDVFVPSDADIEDMHMAGREPGVYGYE
jgi:hypothetical protein